MEIWRHGVCWDDKTLGVCCKCCVDGTHPKILWSSRNVASYKNIFQIYGHTFSMNVRTGALSLTFIDVNFSLGSILFFIGSSIWLHIFYPPYSNIVSSISSCHTVASHPKQWTSQSNTTCNPTTCFWLKIFRFDFKSNATSARLLKRVR